MIFLRMLSIVLGLWGMIELLMGLIGLYTYEVGTSHSLYIGLACLILATIIHIVYKMVKKRRRNKYID